MNVSMNIYEKHNLTQCNGSELIVFTPLCVCTHAHTRKVKRITIDRADGQESDAVQHKFTRPYSIVWVGRDIRIKC